MKTLVFGCWKFHAIMISILYDTFFQQALKLAAKKDHEDFISSLLFVTKHNYIHD